MTFDYKGWGDSEGQRSRLAPYSRVADVQAAMTFLGLQPEVDPERIGLYGTSYGGATVSWVGAVDPRAKCIVSVVGVGDGIRWDEPREAGGRVVRPAGTLQTGPGAAVPHRRI